MEKQLTKQFKRIVIRGKRGRGVPILFTPIMQKTIKFLISAREVTNFVDTENPYLFALPNTMNCIRGSDAIRKLSRESGAKNPENLTSTKLRKQVATVAQLLNLTENDIEQLATFLGHTKDVHKNFYRLSESTFQVAKVSKVLLMMEKGKGQEYRRKNIDEIDININSLVSDEGNDSEGGSSEEETREENINIPITVPEIIKNKIEKMSTKEKNLNTKELKSKINKQRTLLDKKN